MFCYKILYKDLFLYLLDPTNPNAQQASGAQDYNYDVQ